MRRKSIVQASETKFTDELWCLGRRRHCLRPRERGGNVQHTFNRAQIRFEVLPDARLQLVGKIRRQGASTLNGIRRESRMEVPIVQADKTRNENLERIVEPPAREHFPFSGDGDCFGVDQHPIAIKDQGVHRAYPRRPNRRSMSASFSST